MPQSFTNEIRDADTQKIHLRNSSGGWEIRNVGFSGHSSSSNSPVIAPACTDPNQTGIIENCYLGDGGNHAGIWVPPEHAGELIIRNTYIANFDDNGLYGSPPGNHDSHSYPGAGGTVKVENCYSANQNIANFRLGTDGSYIKGCVATGAGHGAYWGFYEHTKVINCDLFGPIRLSDAVWEDPAVVELIDTRWEGSAAFHDPSATLLGESVGQPEDYYPGVPLSPTDAKNGTLTGTPKTGTSYTDPSKAVTNGVEELTVRRE